MALIWDGLRRQTPLLEKGKLKTSSQQLVSAATEAAVTFQAFGAEGSDTCPTGRR